MKIVSHKEIIVGGEKFIEVEATTGWRDLCFLVDPLLYERAVDQDEFLRGAAEAHAMRHGVPVSPRECKP